MRSVPLFALQGRHGHFTLEANRIGEAKRSVCLDNGVFGESAVWLSRAVECSHSIPRLEFGDVGSNFVYDARNVIAWNHGESKEIRELPVEGYCQNSPGFCGRKLYQSLGLTPLAMTLMTTKSAFGSGIGESTMWTSRPELVSNVPPQKFDKRTRFDNSLLHVCLGMLNVVVDEILIVL